MLTNIHYVSTMQPMFQPNFNQHLDWLFEMNGKELFSSVHSKILYTPFCDTCNNMLWICDSEFTHATYLTS